ncbi:ABC transporter ATP-binding protein [Anaerotignum sp.]|uniref:ABC transporter ATP-binding protein n=1 Tax=Anaerotignum sp. TaxID=2039241 RepID=UPI0028B18349|nr:ABC transporter ATP-binding protein [Anaerotignum sp.]
MLRFEGVSFRYPEDTQGMMEDLSFEVADGELVAIIGASGCGKSTIFRLINGLEKPDQGKILVDQKSIETIKNYSAFMPQKDLLFPWRSIEKNVCLPMELAKVPARDQEKKATQVLEQVGLADYAQKFPKDLSGGMKQRVAFARTLLSGADMLLLDEPFSALDYLTRVEMQEWLLRQWEHYHKTILFITHDVEEAIFLAKYIYIIQDSRPFTEMERIQVPLDYPRKREDLKRAEIVELKESLIGKLRRSVSL